MAISQYQVIRLIENYGGSELSQRLKALGRMSKSVVVEVIRQLLKAKDVSGLHRLIESGVKLYSSPQNFHDALLLGDQRLVSALLDAGANPQKTTGYNAAPIVVAARQGQLAIMALLIERGANPQGRNQFYSIDEAIKAGQEDSIVFLLDAGARPWYPRFLERLVIENMPKALARALQLVDDPDEVSDLAVSRGTKGRSFQLWQEPSTAAAMLQPDQYFVIPQGSALMLACALGETEAARLLVEAGADPTKQDGEQRDAKAWAALNGGEPICELMGVEPVSSPLAKTIAYVRGETQADKPDVAALLHSLRNQDRAAFEAEFAGYGDRNGQVFHELVNDLVLDKHAAVLMRIHDMGLDWDYPEINALGVVNLGMTELVVPLLDGRINVHRGNFLHEPPLFLAAKNGDLATMTLLLEHGAKINGVPDGSDGWYRPIDAALEEGQERAACLLFDQGGCSVAEDFFLVAVAYRMNDLVGRLCADGYPVNTPQDFWVGVQEEPPEVKLIANPDYPRTSFKAKNIQDFHQATPLILACALGHARIAEQLIGCGAKIDKSDGAGDTARDWAARHGGEAICTAIQVAPRREKEISARLERICLGLPQCNRTVPRVRLEELPQPELEAWFGAFFERRRFEPDEETKLSQVLSQLFGFGSPAGPSPTLITPTTKSQPSSAPEPEAREHMKQAALASDRPAYDRALARCKQTDRRAQAHFLRDMIDQGEHGLLLHLDRMGIALKVGRRSLFKAIELNHQPLLAAILKGGTNPNQSRKKILGEEKSFSNGTFKTEVITDEYLREWPLDVAIDKGLEKMALLLWDAGARAGHALLVMECVHRKMNRLLAKMIHANQPIDQGCYVHLRQAMAKRRGYELVDVADVIWEEPFGENLDEPFFQNATPLQLACHLGNEEAVDLLLGAGANPDHRDDLGRSARDFAALHGSPTLCKRFEVTPGVPQVELDPQRELFLAVSADEDETVRRLIAAGVDIHAYDNRKLTVGLTPLMVAVLKNSETVIATLLECGVDLNQRDQQSHSRALYATEAIAFKRELVSGVRLGRTALMHAATFAYTEVVQQLLEAEPDVTLKDQVGHTALSLAAYLEDSAAVRGILRRGADPNQDIELDKLEPAIAKIIKKARNKGRLPAGKAPLLPKLEPADLFRLRENYREERVREALAERSKNRVFQGQVEDFANYFNAHCEAAFEDYGGYRVTLPALPKDGMIEVQKRFDDDSGMVVAIEPFIEEGLPAELLVLPTVDPLEPLVLFGPAEDVLEKDTLFPWFARLFKAMPFRLLNLTPRHMIGQFHDSIEDPIALAEAMLARCPYLEEVGDDPLNSLVEELVTSGEFVMWWD